MGKGFGMEPILTPRVFMLRVLPELFNVPATTPILKIFEMAARHQNISHSDAAVRVDYAEYKATGYPPAYVEGAYRDLLKVPRMLLAAE